MEKTVGTTEVEVVATEEISEEQKLRNDLKRINDEKENAGKAILEKALVDIGALGCEIVPSVVARGSSVQWELVVAVKRG